MKNPPNLMLNATQRANDAFRCIYSGKRTIPEISTNVVVSFLEEGEEFRSNEEQKKCAV